MPNYPMGRSTKRSRDWIGLLFAVVIALTAAQTASAAGPSAFWQFEEPAGTFVGDSSPNMNHGRMTGAHRIAGRFGGGLGFDGDAAKVLVPRNATLEPQQITVEAWVRATSPGNFKYIVAKGANNCITGSYGLYTGPNGGLKFYVSSGTEATVVASPDAGPAVWDGEWHHVAGTYDGQSARLYVEGSQVGNGTAGAINIAYAAPIDNNDGYLGFFNDNNECSRILGFTGDIDEPRIWPRALEAPELAASADHGAEGTLAIVESDFESDSIIHTSEVSTASAPNRTVTIAIESASGLASIQAVSIDQFVPGQALATCNTGRPLESTCDIELSNGGRSAALKINRPTSAALNRPLNLRVTLSTGQTVLVNSKD